jgi:hypothetical protein
VNNVILLVFEGETAESQIFDSIRKYFFTAAHPPTLQIIFGAEILQLWDAVHDDEYLDMVEVLRRLKPQGLTGIARDDVSAIYLFFDHDPQSRPKNPDYEANITEMLGIFDNETENGKLYISYPMIEAIKDCKRDLDSHFECEVDISDTVDYKAMVHSRSDFRSIVEYSYQDWLFLFAVTILKAIRLVFGTYGSTDYQDFLRISQKLIHDKQTELFIRPRRSVVILSSVPFFVIGYFGKKRFDALKLASLSRRCNFFTFPTQ